MLLSLAASVCFGALVYGIAWAQERGLLSSSTPNVEHHIQVDRSQLAGTYGDDELVLYPDSSFRQRGVSIYCAYGGEIGTFGEGTWSVDLDAVVLASTSEITNARLEIIRADGRLSLVQGSGTETRILGRWEGR